MTDEEKLERFLEDLLENTQKYKDRSFAQARLEQPHLDEEALEAHGEFAAWLLGLPPTRPAKGPAKA